MPFSDCSVNHSLIKTAPLLLDALPQLFHVLDLLLLLFWHATLGVSSAIRRHQPPQRTVLGQVDCFVQCEVVGSQIVLDGVQPHDTRTPRWSVPVIWWGSR